MVQVLRLWYPVPKKSGNIYEFVSTVTRRVWKKIAQTVAQPTFGKICVAVTVGKSAKKIFGLPLEFKKLPNGNNLVIQSGHLIRGRCYDRNFLRFLTIFCEKFAFF
jgi:hypothetical protein